MKTILSIMVMGILVLLGSVTVGVGQGSPNLPAQFVVEVTDATCSDVQECNSPDANCGLSAAFVVPVEGTYYLTAEMQCSDPAYCKYCQVCAYVVKDGSLDVRCGPSHISCQENQCSHTETCLQLQPGNLYRLVVCKRHCPGVTCDDCPTTCTARAKLTD
ncbi:MAG TPA: hypothetical protein VGL38_01470 [bacterium]|jgi:hypothetical protein